jgi:hypothetical protein
MASFFYALSYFTLSRDVQANLLSESYKLSG